MTALSTAEAALRRAPDDPGVPVTVSGAEAAALVAELDGLRSAVREARTTAQNTIDERDCSYRDAGKLQGYELHEMDGAAALARSVLIDLPEVPDA